MLLDLAAILAPVFLSAGVGYLWARFGQPFDSQFVTALVTTIGTPALVLSTFDRLEVSGTMVGEILLGAVLALVGFAVLGLAALRLLGLQPQSYLPALIFPNAGNMGLPLALFAFGEAGLALAIIYFTVFAVGQFTLGVSIASGSFAPGRLLRMPLLYAVAVALVLLATGTHLPVWLANTVQLVGGMTIPLMLLALGVSLERLRPASLPRSIGLSLLRLLGGFAVGVALAWLLDLSGPVRGVLILQSAMPVAVFNYLFAELYAREPAEVAGMILVSTLISFATLPLLLLFVLP